MSNDLKVVIAIILIAIVGITAAYKFVDYVREEQCKVDSTLMNVDTKYIGPPFSRYCYVELENGTWIRFQRPVR